MNGLFHDKRDFNDDISKWNVSNVTDMSHMFDYCDEDEDGDEQEPIFNGDISGWDVSSVTNMSFMFSDSRFNGNISGWDVSSVTDMYGMFSHSQFNGDISGWDVSSVTNMTGRSSSECRICTLSSCGGARARARRVSAFAVSSLMAPWTSLWCVRARACSSACVCVCVCGYGYGYARSRASVCAEMRVFGRVRQSNTRSTAITHTHACALKHTPHTYIQGTHVLLGETIKFS